MTISNSRTSRSCPTTTRRHILLIGALATLANGVASAAVPEACRERYSEAGAVPFTDSCLMDALLSPSDLGNYICGREDIDEYCSTLPPCDEDEDEDEDGDDDGGEGDGDTTGGDDGGEGDGEGDTTGGDDGNGDDGGEGGAGDDTAGTDDGLPTYDESNETDDSGGTDDSETDNTSDAETTTGGEEGLPEYDGPSDTQDENADSGDDTQPEPAVDIPEPVSWLDLLFGPGVAEVTPGLAGDVLPLIGPLIDGYNLVDTAQDAQESCNTRLVFEQAVGTGNPFAGLIGVTDLATIVAEDFVNPTLQMSGQCPE